MWHQSYIFELLLEHFPARLLFPKLNGEVKHLPRVGRQTRLWKRTVTIRRQVPRFEYSLHPPRGRRSLILCGLQHLVPQLVERRPAFLQALLASAQLVSLRLHLRLQRLEPFLELDLPRSCSGAQLPAGPALRAGTELRGSLKGAADTRAQTQRQRALWRNLHPARLGLRGHKLCGRLLAVRLRLLLQGNFVCCHVRACGVRGRELRAGLFERSLGLFERSLHLFVRLQQLPRRAAAARTRCASGASAAAALGAALFGCTQDSRAGQS